MMGHCKDCEHWKMEQSPGDESDHFCALTVSEDGASKSPRVTLAIARDAEAYWARLITEPNFGCVQFEPKVVP